MCKSFQVNGSFTLYSDIWGGICIFILNLNLNFKFKLNLLFNLNLNLNLINVILLYNRCLFLLLFSSTYRGFMPKAS